MDEIKNANSKTSYKKMEEISKLRHTETSKMVPLFIEMTDMYGELICKLTELLGNINPKSDQDRIVRDIYNDVFDSLYESRELILSTKISVAFPLLRRAFESQSLLAVFIQDKNIADQWNQGKEFQNSELRDFLESKAKFKENKEDLKELYKFYTKGSHPNRILISERFLGEGNQFTLGTIGAPNLILLTQHLLKLTDLWFWFCSTIVYFYSKEINEHQFSLLLEYSSASNKAKETKKWLSDQLLNLFEETPNN